MGDLVEAVNALQGTPLSAQRGACAAPLTPALTEGPLHG
jgi:hypothetical protein